MAPAGWRGGGSQGGTEPLPPGGAPERRAFAGRGALGSLTAVVEMKPPHPVGGKAAPSRWASAPTVQAVAWEAVPGQAQGTRGDPRLLGSWLPPGPEQESRAEAGPRDGGRAGPLSGPHRPAQLRSWPCWGPPDQEESSPGGERA